MEGNGAGNYIGVKGDKEGEKKYWDLKCINCRKGGILRKDRWRKMG